MLAREINSATRGGTVQALSLGGPLRQKVEALFAAAEVPDSLAAHFLASRHCRVVRRDPGIHQVSLIVWRGADRLRLFLNRVSGAATFCALMDGSAYGSTPRSERLARGLRKLADPWQGASGEALPVVHVLAQHRIWDGYLQAALAGMSEHEHPERAMAFHLVPGQTVVDPRTLLSGRIAMTPAGEEGLARAHHIAALAEVPQNRRMREFAAAALPARHADADALFVSLEVEQNQWVEQVAACAALLNRAHNLGVGFRRVLVNGMTAPWDGRPADFFETIEAVERQMVATIRQRLVYDAEVTEMFGLTFDEKIEAMRAARFAMSPIGSAALVANLLAVPGVTYANADRAQFIRWSDHPRMARVPADLLRDRDDVAGHGKAPVNPRLPRLSYSIGTRDFVRFAMGHYRRTCLAPQGRQPPRRADVAPPLKGEGHRRP